MASFLIRPTRSRRVAIAFVALAVACSLIVAPPGGAPALAGEAEDAEAAKQHLIDIVPVLESMAFHEEFNELLPMTGASLASSIGLDLSGVFSATLRSTLQSTPVTSAAELQAAIEAASSGDVTYTGATVAADLSSVVVPVAISRSIDLPVAYTNWDDILIEGDVDDGYVTTAVDYSATFEFVFDPVLDDWALLVDGTPDVTASIAPSAVDAFTSNYGFTDVAVTGTASGSLTIESLFRDVDDDGAVTEAEYLTSALEDLYITGFAPGPDYAVTLSLDSPLTAAAVDGTISFDAGTGLPPVPDLSDPDFILSDLAVVAFTPELDALANSQPVLHPMPA